MTPAIQFPGPRDGLDEGSLAELAQDSRQIEIELSNALVANAGWERRPSVASAAGPIDIPDQAPALVDGLAAYGPCN